MPLRPVEDPVHALARVGHLPLDADLVRIQVHQPPREAEAARAQEALVDPRRPEDVRAEVADERHRREPQRPAGHEHRDPGRVRECGCDEQAVRDHDELALRAQLEREVVRRRAGVERDCLTLADHLRGGVCDGPLPLDLQPQPQIEADLRLALLERPYAAADPRDEALPRELGEVAANRHLGDGKGFRKFRNRNVITRLEQAEYVLHAFGLGKIANVRDAVDAGDPTPARRTSQYCRVDLRNSKKRKQIRNSVADASDSRG